MKTNTAGTRVAAREVVFAGRRASAASTDGPRVDTIEVRFIYSPDEPDGAVHSRRFDQAVGSFAGSLNVRGEPVPVLGCPCGTL